jgi:hypothetical protein
MPGWVTEALQACETVLDSFVRNGATALASHPAFTSTLTSSSNALKSNSRKRKPSAAAAAAAALLERALYLTGEAVMVGFETEESGGADTDATDAQEQGTCTALRHLHFTLPLLYCYHV